MLAWREKQSIFMHPVVRYTKPGRHIAEGQTSASPLVCKTIRFTPAAGAVSFEIQLDRSPGNQSVTMALHAGFSLVRRVVMPDIFLLVHIKEIAAGFAVFEVTISE